MFLHFRIAILDNGKQHIHILENMTNKQMQKNSNQKQNNN